MPRTFLALPVFLAFTISAISQTAVTTTSTSQTSDPPALTLAAQAMAALTGGQQVSDVTLTGTATETAGATVNSGTATFKAKGLWESRTDFGASNHAEIRTLDSSGHPIGAWTTPDGMTHAMAFHNVWSDAALFFPALSSLSAATQTNMIAKYVGQETIDGSTVQHLEFFHTADSTLSALAGDLPALSRIDIFLDATSLLPVETKFITHANSDANVNIAIEVDYSNYQSVNGVQIPFHVQKLLSGGVIVDFLVSQTAINTGLADSTFAIQQ